MKIIKTFLWIQIILGILLGLLALVKCNEASEEYSEAVTLRAVQEGMTKAADYHEPPGIGRWSIDQILREFQATSHTCNFVAVILLYTCGAMVMLAIVMLRLGLAQKQKPGKKAEFQHNDLGFSRLVFA
jgi:hypothetical protein